MGLTLFIAEKPAVARDLAAALGARKSGSRPCFEGEGVWVSWCIGHLVEVAEPGDHDPAWKRWSAEQLPMLPRQLVLRPVKRTADHFRALSGLLGDARVTEVVNACDAGREGELIFRYVYGLSGCTRPVRRFWVSSLTAEAIKAGLRGLRPGTDFDALAAAARCRAEADWLVGMNATRGLTARGGTLLTVGRVQTPTLAMVVDRELAIEAFVPEDFWQVHATAHPPGLSGASGRGESGRDGSGRDGSGRDGSGGTAEASAARPLDFRVRWVGSVAGGAVGDGPSGAETAVEDPEAEAPGPEAAEARAPGRLTTAEAAAALVAKLEGAPGVISAAERTQKRVPPPPLYDLTALQREANARFGVSAKDTLDAAQALYEKHKLLTYPRTDSRHLSADVARTLPETLDALAQAAAPWASTARQLGARPARNLLRDKRFVDDAQVSDHHAILPTAKVPDLGRLSGLERRIYELVVRRLLAAHAPDAVWAHGRIEVEAVGERLEARGRTCLEPGWEAVDPPRRAPAVAAGRDAGASAGAARGGRGARSEGGSSGGARGPEAEVELPLVKVGEAVRLADAEASAHQTRPPPRYTEASLLGAMERAGRELDEAALRAAMREGGLGTPATRAATLETLVDRAYIAREGRALVPLPAGRALIQALPVAVLKSPRLTGEWEARLARIARGQEDALAFRRDIRAFVRAAVADILAAPAVQIPEAASTDGWRARAGRKRRSLGSDGEEAEARRGSTGKARGRAAGATGRGRRANADAAAGASTAAGASLSRGAQHGRAAGKPASAGRVAGRAGAARVARASGSARTRGETGGADVRGEGRAEGERVWTTGLSGGRREATNPEGRWAEAARQILAADEGAASSGPATSKAGTAESPVGRSCPACGAGRLLAGRAAWGCDRWREGCGFTLPFAVDGVLVPPEEAVRLLARGGQTRLFAQREGRRWRLVRDPTAPQGVRWTPGAR